MKPYLKIKHPDGSEFQTDVMNLKLIDFNIPPLQVDFIKEQVDLGVGSRIVGTRVLERTLTAIFHFYYKDMSQLRRMEQQIAEAFSASTEIIVSESIDFSRQYRVTPMPYTIDRGNATRATITIPLQLLIGLSESYNIVDETFDVLVSNNEVLFYNLGTYEIDQRNKAEMQIEFTGQASNIEITNLTTNDKWTYNGSIDIGDILVLRDYTAYLNGTNVLDKTNQAVITFKPGKNNIRIKGLLSNSKLRIKTRMYFM